MGEPGWGEEIAPRGVLGATWGKVITGGGVTLGNRPGRSWDPSETSDIVGVVHIDIFQRLYQNNLTNKNKTKPRNTTQRKLK